MLKFYPVLIAVIFLAAFGSTLFFPPPMVFRFATLQNKKIKGSLAEKRILGYCRTVTLVWCGFFVVNGSIAALTIFSGSDILWAVYNGGVSYILMGILFAGEFIVRKMVDKKNPVPIPISRFRPSSRAAETVLCCDGVWPTGTKKTWADFLRETAALRTYIQARPAARWILHCEDCWLFLVSYAALLQCKKTIMLTANVTPAYLAEMRGGDDAFLTDKALSAEDAAGETGFLPELLKPEKLQPAAPELFDDSSCPVINADETEILMYTSGTTGRPKVVRQRLTEFENDNAFILSKWGCECAGRVLCSTVSQHHIYGILFSIMLPFTAGIPFRRRRIEYPEEFEVMTDARYMIVTVPAFLKRAAEMENLDLRLNDPWIWTSGGAVPPETAKKTDERFGFWPLEVYGSTETSGIAYRQSKNGMQWTPFDNAQVWVAQDGPSAGCLVIRSPYIKDPAGFTTGDLAEINADGTFMLKGRADSIVKIEEKRVSLPEVENRLMQTGLVKDAAVVALADRRQYLAAAIVFNGEGKAKFDSMEKADINLYFRQYLSGFFEAVVIPKKWRYLDALPLDSQGKKKKAALEALFAPAETFDLHGAVLKLLQRSDTEAALEVSVPPECEYFDGHFPAFKLLPGVAQTDIVLRAAARYLGTSVCVKNIKRIKFVKPVSPGTTLKVEIKKSGADHLEFSMTDAADGAAYALGTIVTGEHE